MILNIEHIVFIDRRVAGSEALAATLGANTQWFSIDTDRDGVEQVRQALTGFTNLSSIQIVSHGSPGTLLLGGTLLNSENLPAYREALAAIGATLATDGDLLLYGCEIGSGIEGQAFIEQLAQITGADVAASIDFTGASDLGGNWTLEATVGDIETQGLSTSGFTGLLANTAPVLTAVVPSLAAITEDDTTNPGQTVASILGASLSDVDAGALHGLALYGTSGTFGKWQYSTSGGSSWANVGVVSTTSALLLRDTDLLRWQPDATNGTTATLSYFGWDRSFGAAANKLNVSTRGGTTPFSIEGDVATLDVSALPDAPIVKAPLADQSVEEDAAFTFTLAESALVDIDQGNSLTYSAALADGTNLPSWLTFDAEARRFNGTARNEHVGTHGITVTITDTTALSAADTFIITVQNVNDAPVLTPASPTLAAITEDDINNQGQTVASILGSSLTDADPDALRGIALHGATGTHGKWQYSMWGEGWFWVDVAPVSTTSALLLRDTDLLRWRPDGKGETVAALNYVGWDQTTGTAGVKVATSFSGETSAFSESSDSATLQVTSVNDAPIFWIGDGKLTTAIGTSTDRAYSVTLQPDDKILVAGYSRNSSGNDDFALVRYTDDGNLDATFDGDGLLTTTIGPGNDYGRSVTLQPDGKILVAGYSRNSSDNDDFALARYVVNGSLDTTFGSNGKLTHAFGSSADRVHSVTLQPDGKILVAGYSWNGSNSDFALARYNASGSLLDTTFDNDGKVTTVIGSGTEVAYSVTLQSDGKILVAGYSRNSSGNDDFALGKV